MSEVGRATRRSSSENRKLLLGAAQELFRANGYAQTTTKQITEHAGVVESTLFRHFGSKAEIFKATVVEPCTQVFGAWASSVRDDPDGSLEAFVANLARLVLHNRDVLLSLVVADYQGDSELSSLAEEIRREVISSVEAMATTGSTALGSRWFGGDQTSVGVGTLFGLVLGTILLQNWIFGGNLARPDEDALVAGIVAMVMHGLRGGEGTPVAGAAAGTASA